MPTCPTCGQELAAFGDPCPDCGPAAVESTLEAASADGVAPAPGLSVNPTAGAGDTTIVPEAAGDTTVIMETPGVTCPVCGFEHDGEDACPACGALQQPVPCDEHPGQTAHSRCVLCGRTVCKRDADESRRPALCAEHREVTVIEGWVQVYSSGTVMNAQLMADNLRAEGVDSQLYTQSDRSFPVDLGELSVVRVMVPVWEYGQAMEVIRDYSDAAGEVSFACPECGEVFEPGAKACASCGAPLAA
jgi:hypothetical protein